MKQILFALCITLFFAACKEPANPPTVVLDGMFAAMKNGNIDDMKKFGEVKKLSPEEIFGY